MIVPLGPLGDLMKQFAGTICNLIQTAFGFIPF